MSDELNSDDWALSLPQHLQAIVDAAPHTVPELDVLFEEVVDSNWSDLALRARARAVYYEDPTYIEPLPLGTPGAAESGDFAAEMRVRRERSRR